VAWAQSFGGTEWDIQAVLDDYGPGIDFSRYVEFSDTTNHFIAVWDDDVWASPMPVRPWICAPNTSGEVHIEFGAPPMADPDYEAAWAALILAVQDWLIVALDPESVAAIQATISLNDLDQIVLGTMAFILDEEEATPSYLVWCFSTTQLDNTFGDQIFLAGFPSFSPAISPTRSAIMIGGDISRIAEAAEVISLQDQEISINHGQAMYSVKGKITTG
jgi:hypothetical protein